MAYPYLLQSCTAFSTIGTVTGTGAAAATRPTNAAPGDTAAQARGGTAHAQETVGMAGAALRMGGTAGAGRGAHCLPLFHMAMHLLGMILQFQACRSPPPRRRRTPPSRGLHMFVAGLNFITTERVRCGLYN